MWSQRTHLFQQRGPNISDSANHRRAARNVNIADFRHTDSKHFLSHLSMSRIDKHLSAFGQEDSDGMLDDVVGTFLGTQHMYRPFVHALRSQLRTVRDSLRALPSICSRPGLRDVAAISDDLVLVPLDRDIHRHALLPTHHYQFLLIHNFLSDTTN
jgi:hypothetical protein